MDNGVYNFAAGQQVIVEGISVIGCENKKQAI